MLQKPNHLRTTTSELFQQALRLSLQTCLPVVLLAALPKLLLLELLAKVAQQAFQQNLETSLPQLFEDVPDLEAREQKHCLLILTLMVLLLLSVLPLLWLICWVWPLLLLW